MVIGGVHENDSLNGASPTRTPPRHAHLHQGDAIDGDAGPGSGVLYWHRAIRGITGVLSGLWHDFRDWYSAKPGDRHTVYDEHTLAAAGCDRGDGDTHTNTYPTPEPDTETSMPGQPAHPYDVLEGGADRNPGTARATTSDRNTFVLLNGGRGELHILAPDTGELTDG